MKRYVTGIDGLRAIAVVAVLGFHAFPGKLPGGFIGVDVFFVVSGFIITRTYLDALQSRAVTLTHFYAKRVRRLAPAYLVVLLATTAGAYLFLTPPLLKTFSVSLGAQPLYGQNVTFWLEGDYFDKALTKPLLHTWSLAVEEQFYLGYGLLVLLARRSRRLAVPAIVLGGLVSIGLAHVLAGVSPKTAFYWLPTRIWEFAVGLLLARSTIEPAGAAARLARVAGLVMVGGSIVLFGEAARFPGAQSLLACLGSALVLWSLSERAPRSAFLEHPVMTYLGRTSYSLYLWHWPLIAIASTRLGRTLTAAEGAAALAATFALSHASYHWLEEPFRRGVWMPRDRSLVGLVAAVGVAVLAVAVGLHRTDGAADRYPAEIAKLYRAQQDRSPYRCSLWSRIRSYPGELCPINDVAGGGGVLVVGDSHADQLDELIAGIAARDGIPAFLAARNCALADLGAGGSAEKPYCGKRTLDRLVRDVRSKDIRHVVAISWLKPGVDAPALRRAADRLFEAGVHRLIVMQVVPTGEAFDPRAHIRALERGAPRPATPTRREHEERTAIQRQAIAELQAHSDRITVVDPAPVLCGDGSCAFERDGKPVYFDNNHLSPSGVKLLGPMFEGALGALGGARAGPYEAALKSGTSSR